MAGLTENGLTIKRLPEVLEDIINKERELIDSGIITTDDSIIGQLNSIIGSSIAQLWELAQAVNDNFNKNKAEGKNLDDLGDIIGIYRISESNTFGDVRFTTRDGLTLNAGTLVLSPTTNYRFEVASTTIVSALACVATTLRVVNVNNSTAYTVRINGVEYLYTSDSDTSALEIVTGLKALIDADTDATWTATIELNNDLTITSDSDSEISVVVIPFISVRSAVRDVRVVCIEPGPISAPPNTVTQLVSANTEVLSLTNPGEFSPGRLEESDEDFRRRFNISSANGKATLAAIRDNLTLLDGVSYVNVIENETLVTDSDSRPPKSFEAIVLGGEDVDVATSVWDTKPAGIEMYGNTTEIITDEYGIQRTVEFTRPVIINMAIQVTYTIYDEEMFPSGGEEAIKNTVLAAVNALGVDVDVIPTRLFGPIYSAVPGIDNLIVEVQELANPGDAPVVMDWQEARFPIGAREYAQTTLGDIDIVDATP